METITSMNLKGGKERMKKLKILLFTILILAMVFISNNSFATTGTYENLKYEITNNQVTITGYEGEITNITIPEKIEGYPVTKIKDSAFSNCKTLKSIIIPNSITEIGWWAFQWSGITEIVIPNSVNKIGESAFSYCENLSSVTLPSNLKEIPASLFANCKNLTKITIPNSVTEIGGGAFSDTGIIELVIPSSVTKIWYGAFGNCANLTTITIPSSVTFLADDGNGDYLFYIDSEGITPFEERMTMYVEKGSYEESYAKKYNYMYKIIGNEENNETVTAIIDIVDKDGKTQAGAGEDDTLYSMIDVPTGSNYGECYYQLYLKSYIGKSFNVNGLGTFNFDKKDNVSDYGEQYIYKCKIANPEFFYKAGIKEYSATYTVEETNKTYTTKFKVKVTGLEVKTYEVKADKKVAISLTGAMGNNSLEVNTIDKENKTYVEMVSMLNVDGKNVDIYAYDINVEGQYEGELTLTFEVGKEYNGRKATILHMKKDNTTEKFEVIVENGKVTVKVNGLSPFMVAIENTNTTETPKEETKKEHKLDETPKTGTTFEVASILSIIALISIAGIVITNKYKK